jgi:hypothetical protein
MRSKVSQYAHRVLGGRQWHSRWYFGWKYGGSTSVSIIHQQLVHWSFERIRNSLQRLKRRNGAPMFQPRDAASR